MSGPATRATARTSRASSRLREGVFSLAVNGLISLSDVPTDFPLHAELQGAGVTDDGRDGSGIAAPDGTWIGPPVVGQERLVIADLELRRVSEKR